MSALIPGSIEGLTLVSGRGAPEDGTACIVSAARIVAGEAGVDEPRLDVSEHVAPEIRLLALGVNDWPLWESDEERTTYLAPLVTTILGTADPRPPGKVSPLGVARLWKMTDRAVRAQLPLVLEATENDAASNDAEALRGLPPVTAETATTTAGHLRRLVARLLAAAREYEFFEGRTLPVVAAERASMAIVAASHADVEATPYAVTHVALRSRLFGASVRERVRDALIATLVETCATKLETP